MFKIIFHAKEKITKTQIHKETTIKFEKSHSKVVTYIFKLIQSFL